MQKNLLSNQLIAKKQNAGSISAMNLAQQEDAQGGSPVCPKNQICTHSHRLQGHSAGTASFMLVAPAIDTSK
jgi:hypothetical protein